MELIDVRCPFKKRAKSNETHLYTCNRLCLRVYPGSSGEAFCFSCKANFEFDVTSQGHYQHKVKVKQA